MTKLEKKYLQKLAQTAWEKLVKTEECCGVDSNAARAIRGEWFAYDKICKELNIEYSLM